MRPLDLNQHFIRRPPPARGNLLLRPEDVNARHGRELAVEQLDAGRRKKISRTAASAALWPHHESRLGSPYSDELRATQTERHIAES